MSKERLEEIIEELPYSIRYSGEMEELISFAKEQADRVDNLLKQTGHNFEVNRKLDAQNKRYREALENIKSVRHDDNFNPYAYMMLEIIEWAEKALEGEE